MGILKLCDLDKLNEELKIGKEYIESKDLGFDILMRKVRVNNPNNLLIKVGLGEMMLFFNGKIITYIVNAPGYYTLDNNVTDSFLGNINEEIFNDIKNNYRYDTGAPSNMFVIYINTKEIDGNKFGTIEPLMFNDWSHATKNNMNSTTLPLKINIKSYGTYVFKVTNIVNFMTKVVGISEEYNKSNFISEVRLEILDIYSRMLNELGNNTLKISIYNLINTSNLIRSILSKKIMDQSLRELGISLVTFNIEAVSYDEESEKAVVLYEENMDDTKVDDSLPIKLNDNHNVSLYGASFINKLYKESVTGVKKCPNCGYENHNSNYCGNCGKPL